MKRIESVFLNYANLDFRDQEARKQQLGDLVRTLFVFSGPRNVIQSRFDFLIELLPFTDYREAQRFIKDNPLPEIDHKHREVAFEALFAYRQGFCKSRCPLRGMREKMFPEDLQVRGQGRLRASNATRQRFGISSTAYLGATATIR